MFRYINEILGNFTQRERVLVLILLLFTIVVITVGNNLLKTAKGLPEDTERYIDTLISEKNKLRIELIESKRGRINDGIECTNTILKRELEIREEIRLMIQMAKEEGLKYQRIEYPSLLMKSINEGDSLYPPPVMIPKEVVFNPMEELIKKMESVEKNIVTKGNER